MREEGGKPESNTGAVVEQHPARPQEPGEALLPEFRRPRHRPAGTFTLGVLGVLAPAVTIGVELVTRMCAEGYVDPLPTPLHVPIALSVPVVHAIALRFLKREERPPERWLLAANGFAFGVAALYLLPFLPMLPIAAFGILFFGLGLLPMTPLFATVAAVHARRRLRERLSAGDQGRRPFWLGVGAAVVVLFAANLPLTLTRIGLKMAADPEPGRSRRGVDLLRTFGSEDVMLRACYSREAVPFDPLSLLLVAVVHGDAPGAAPARVVYYRVTGQAFTAARRPAVRTLLAGDPFVGWDFDQGGEAVGGTRTALSLASSRIDASVDAEAALAYVEWTLELKNDGLQPEEARAHVALPAGAVVSRVSLWVAGEEREAAFAGRGQARQAYANVVRRQRDPLLVTTAGPDRVMVQCFPVPPGGAQKARIGLTVPLDLISEDRAALMLPHIVERNFRTAEGPVHAVWIESKGALEGELATLRFAARPAGGGQLQGSVTDGALAQGLRIVVPRDASVTEVWTADTLAAPTGQDVRTHAIRQRLTTDEVEPFAHLVIVVDGSRSLEEARPAVARALARVAGRIGITSMVARDGATEPRTGADGIRSLETTAFVGGHDNVPALVTAWDVAAASPRAAVVWIHGPQPEPFGGLAPLRQRLERRRDGPQIFMLAATPGPNRVLEQLDGLDTVHPRPVTGKIESDVERLLTDLVRTRRVRAIREQVDGSALPIPRTSDHLARLWAFDRVRALAADGAPEGRTEATKLATRYRLVTPVSGAVVLETQQDYARAGLEAPNPTTVPTIPEPGMAALVAAVLFAIGAAWLRRRRAAAWQ
jgi:hypothetical protein